MSLAHRLNGIPTDYANEYDRTFFQVEGSKITSSLSQVLANGSGYANGETRLSDVVGANRGAVVFAKS